MINCPLIHFSRSKDIIIKKHNYTIGQERRPYSRKLLKKSNSLKLKSFITHKFKKYRLKKLSKARIQEDQRRLKQYVDIGHISVSSNESETDSSQDNGEITQLFQDLDRDFVLKTPKIKFNKDAFGQTEWMADSDLSDEI